MKTVIYQEVKRSKTLSKPSSCDEKSEKQNNDILTKYRNLPTL